MHFIIYVTYDINWSELKAVRNLLVSNKVLYNKNKNKRKREKKRGSSRKSEKWGERESEGTMGTNWLGMIAKIDLVVGRGRGKNS